MRVQPAVREQADAFVAAEWRGHMIGVHYRGTDKWEDAPRVAYEQMAAVIRKAMSGKSDSRIFLATDEAAFVDYLEKTFPRPGRVAPDVSIR